MFEAMKKLSNAAASQGVRIMPWQSCWVLAHLMAGIPAEEIKFLEILGHTPPGYSGRRIDLFADVFSPEAARWMSRCVTKVQPMPFNFGVRDCYLSHYGNKVRVMGLLEWVDPFVELDRFKQGAHGKTVAQALFPDECEKHGYNAFFSGKDEFGRPIPSDKPQIPSDKPQQMELEDLKPSDVPTVVQAAEPPPLTPEPQEAPQEAVEEPVAKSEDLKEPEDLKPEKPEVKPCMSEVVTTREFAQFLRNMFSHMNSLGDREVIEKFETVCRRVREDRSLEVLEISVPSNMKLVETLIKVVSEFVEQQRRAVIASQMTTMANWGLLENAYEALIRGKKLGRSV